jgi:hypothetical protein
MGKINEFLTGGLSLQGVTKHETPMKYRRRKAAVSRG